jgi:hypothetical protein
VKKYNILKLTGIMQEKRDCWMLLLNSIACSNGTDCAEGIALRQICANRGFHLPGSAAGIGNERSYSDQPTTFLQAFIYLFKFEKL